MVTQLVGIFMILIGSTYCISPVFKLDERISRTVQRLFVQLDMVALFQELWHLGKTPFAIITLVCLTAFHWERGLIASLGFLITIGIERLVKILFKRTRPFIQTHTIMMLQPKKPTDPAFPSGDCLRIWYIALILPAIPVDPAYLLPVTIFLAVLVSLGRVVLGVHYLTDVISGSGFGLLAAGTTLWVWQLFLG